MPPSERGRGEETRHLLSPWLRLGVLLCAVPVTFWRRARHGVWRRESPIAPLGCLHAAKGCTTPAAPARRGAEPNTTPLDQSEARFCIRRGQFKCSFRAQSNTQTTSTPTQMDQQPQLARRGLMIIRHEPRLSSVSHAVRSGDCQACAGGSAPRGTRCARRKTARTTPPGVRVS